MTPIPVKYVGTRARKRCDHILPGSALEWEQGQIHFVPAPDALKLLKFPDVWVAANEADLADESRIGMVLDPDDTPAVVETEEQRAEREEHERATLESLPNLEPLNKESIAQFAKREFGLDIDITTTKKAEMLALIRGVAGSRAATAQLAAPGRVEVPVEPPAAPVVVELQAAGVMEAGGMRIEGSAILPPGFIPPAGPVPSLPPDPATSEPEAA